MRRRWVTVLAVLVGLFGLVVGFTTGLLLQPIDPNRMEAAGTWFVGVVGVLAVLVLAFRSERSAERLEQERLQREANNVFCDVRLVGMHAAADRQIVIVDQVDVEVINYSTRVITGIVYEVPLRGFDSPLLLSEALGPGERAGETHRVPSPFNVQHKDDRHLRGAEFRFSLDGVVWSKRYGRPAERPPDSRSAESPTAAAAGSAGGT